MSSKGTDALCDRVEAAVDYCIKEFDMTLAEVIGSLAFIQHLLISRELKEHEG